MEFYHLLADSMDSQAKNSEGSHLQSDMDHELGTPTLAEERPILHGQKLQHQSNNEGIAQVLYERFHVLLL